MSLSWNRLNNPSRFRRDPGRSTRSAGNLSLLRFAAEQHKLNLMSLQSSAAAAVRSEGFFPLSIGALLHRVTMSWHYRLGLEPRWGISLVEADWKSKEAALRASRAVPNPRGAILPIRS